MSFISYEELIDTDTQKTYKNNGQNIYYNISLTSKNYEINYSTKDLSIVKILKTVHGEPRIIPNVVLNGTNKLTINTNRIYPDTWKIFLKLSNGMRSIIYINFIRTTHFSTRVTYVATYTKRFNGLISTDGKKTTLPPTPFNIDFNKAGPSVLHIEYTYDKLPTKTINVRISITGIKVNNTKIPDILNLPLVNLNNKWSYDEDFCGETTSGDIITFGSILVQITINGRKWLNYGAYYDEIYKVIYPPTVPPTTTTTTTTRNNIIRESSLLSPTYINRESYPSGTYIIFTIIGQGGGGANVAQGGFGSGGQFTIFSKETIRKGKLTINQGRSKGAPTSITNTNSAQDGEDTILSYYEQGDNYQVIAPGGKGAYISNGSNAGVGGETVYTKKNATIDMSNNIIYDLIYLGDGSKGGIGTGNATTLGNGYILGGGSNISVSGFGAGGINSSYGTPGYWDLIIIPEPYAPKIILTQNYGYTFNFEIKNFTPTEINGRYNGFIYNFPQYTKYLIILYNPITQIYVWWQVGIIQTYTSISLTNGRGKFDLDIEQIKIYNNYKIAMVSQSEYCIVQSNIITLKLEYIWTEISSFNTTYPGAQINSSSVTADFKKIVVTDGAVNKLYYSTDSGNSWTINNSYQYVPVEENGSIAYISPNGRTILWSISKYKIVKLNKINSDPQIVFPISADTNKYVFSKFASSTDGSVVWAAIPTDKNGVINRVYKSTNYGYTWSILGFTYPETKFVCCSSDGNKVYCLTGPGHLIYSLNGGSTWIPSSGSEEYAGICCSANGNTVYKIYKLDKRIYKSTNAGNTWTELTAVFIDNGVTYLPLNIVCSGDGLKIAINLINLDTEYDLIYTSLNGGLSWRTPSTRVINSITERCVNISMTPDGLNILVSTCDPDDGTSHLYKGTI